MSQIHFHIRFFVMLMIYVSSLLKLLTTNLNIRVYFLTKFVLFTGQLYNQDSRLDQRWTQLNQETCLHTSLTHWCDDPHLNAIRYVITSWNATTSSLRSHRSHTMLRTDKASMWRLTNENKRASVDYLMNKPEHAIEGLLPILNRSPDA